MAALLYIATYCSLATFAIGCLWRAWQYAKLPVHLRWELYPVPHEPSPRAAHGGSYFEESEWWTKARRLNRAGEFAAMMREIFLLETVRKAKPSLWWRSQLFHSGVFLMIAAIGFEAAGAMAETTRLAFTGRIVGFAGLLLLLTGSLLLLWRRISDAEMRDYTHPADVVHLVALAIAATLLLAGSLNPKAPGILHFARAAVSFDTGLKVPAILAAGMFLSAALVAYVPFSRMAHFIGKYFGYHAVRWDDRPNRGGKLGRALANNLELKPTWSASHIGADGRKNWAEIGTGDPPEVRR
ncbi:MAG TPA: respiratory nitrate reductase subunit gamma [Terriglobales bacterium]|nr:respiratory nitrate reductase subunit gamma [Terriglobales bacterium]